MMVEDIGMMATGKQKLGAMKLRSNENDES